MPLFKLIVFLNPVEGRDEEFNEWYDNRHVPDALSISCFNNGQRFVTGPTYMNRDAPCRYAALYEMEAETIEDALSEANEGMGRFFISDAVDLATAHAFPLTPLGPVFNGTEEALSHAKAAAKV